ncbi:MAG TPA: hypothetical protein VD859_15320 [Nocardioides sp.]|nr:hypothetical protein [Nocardioides sp.]
MSRVLTGLVAVVSALLLALTVAPTSVQAQEAQAKPEHEIRKFKAGETSNGKFFAKGKVVTYQGKVVKLQRQTNGNGAFKSFTKQRTSKKDGQFRFVFDGPLNSCYRLLIPKTKKNAITKREIGCIVPD